MIARLATFHCKSRKNPISGGLRLGSSANFLPGLGSAKRLSGHQTPVLRPAANVLAMPDRNPPINTHPAKPARTLEDAAKDGELVIRAARVEVEIGCAWRTNRAPSP
jgi:hypothetical protein